MQWMVDTAESGQKLVNFLKEKLGSSYSARQIKSCIEYNGCYVNHRLEHFASTVLAKGDKVSLPAGILQKKPSVSFHFLPSQIIYEDEELLVYNKPAGVASDGQVLIEALKAYNVRWELLHRLDRDTTGLLMFTQGKAFREKMVTAFKKQEIDKVYLALIDGIPRQEAGSINNYLGKIHGYLGQSLWGSVPPAKGQQALTAWKVQKKGPKASLVHCYPRTGRTHQIRVHMSEMGHPILGDRQYGKLFHCSYYSPRCLLHAYELSFIHPTLLRKMYFQAPIPLDFQQAMAQVL
ncbi:RluA family pseudouridine synthase [Neochlamydia sp. AcF84]|uniref:RluA family pseudouridine synthase n=1 Tax=Neochlamydia sp. AcF84 TaxID=2315858 RepID=UPI00140CF5E1|nr:RluA family pseudouridine synthase [Neochlamydia sp. AcF84]